MRRPSRAIPLALVAAIVVGLPVAAVTESPAERGLKERLGLVQDANLPGCMPVQPVAGWSEAPGLPELRDEPRATVWDGKVYLAGGILRITDYGKPSDVPGVRERVAVEASDQLTRFDPATGRYDELPPMPQELSHIGFVAHEGMLYVMGGHGDLLMGADVRRDVFRYDIAKATWKRLPSMATPRAAAGASVVGDRIVMAGGMAQGGDVLRDVEAFDVLTGRWGRLPEMRERREHTSLVTIDGDLYALAGRGPFDDSLAGAERLRAGADAWEPIADLAVPTGGAGAAVADGRIVVMGGGDDKERRVVPDVQRFDPATGRWERLGRMRAPRHGLAVTAIGDRLWAIGGSRCALFAPVTTVDVLDLGALPS